MGWDGTGQDGIMSFPSAFWRRDTFFPFHGKDSKLQGYTRQHVAAQPGRGQSLGQPFHWQQALEGNAGLLLREAVPGFVTVFK